MRLGIKDHKVIAAFVEQRPARGLKLDTDGERLDGSWMGGARIAEWIEGKRGLQIVLNDLGSRAAQSVHLQVRHHAAPYQMADYDPTKRRSGR